MRDNKHPGRVEDYTDAFLAVLLVTLFMGFWVIAALFGFLWVVLSAAIIDRVITRLPRRQ